MICTKPQKRKPCNHPELPEVAEPQGRSQSKNAPELQLANSHISLQSEFRPWLPTWRGQQSAAWRCTRGPFKAQRYSYCSVQIFTTRGIPRMRSRSILAGQGRVWRDRMYCCGTGVSRRSIGQENNHRHRGGIHRRACAFPPRTTATSDKTSSFRTHSVHGLSHEHEFPG